MREVKIIQGTYGYRENGILDPKDRFSAPFPLDDAEAERIVSLGIAEYADSGVATSPVSVSDNETGEYSAEETEAQEGDFSALEKSEYSTASTVAELRMIAKEIGVSFKVGMTKEDMVAALDAHFEEDAPMLEASALVDGI